MAIKFSNLASTTLASAVSDTATSISVTSASSFPTLGTGDYFYASLGIGSGSEVVKVTAVSGTTLTVVRGQDDTTAISHDSGVEIALRVTAASLNDLSTQADTESVSISGDTMTGALQGTQIGLGGTPHSTAALTITTTNQHIRLNNGSELGVISLLSGGELDIWSHGDGETINLRTGSGAGTVALAITGANSVFSGSVTAPTLQTSSGNIVITGQEIYSNSEYSGNDGAVRINRFGYQGGQTKFRDVNIYDGKGTSILTVDGSTGNTNIPNGSLMVGSTTAPEKPVHIKSADNQPLRVESTDAYSGIELKDSGSATLPPLISSLSDGFLLYGGHASTRPLLLNLSSSGATFSGAVTIDGTTFLDGGNGYFRDSVGNSFSSGWNANSDDHSTWINFEGYQGGTTKFRDLRIGNGKQQAIAMFDGSSGHFNVYNSLMVGATTAPTGKLDVEWSINSPTGGVYLKNNSTGTGAYTGIYYGNNVSDTDAFVGLMGGNNTAYYGGARSFVLGTNASTPVALMTGGAERMRVNGAGDWMVSNTVANVASNHTNQAGVGWVDSDHHFEIATTSDRAVLEIGKNHASDGDLIQLRKQATIVGTLGTKGGYLTVDTGSLDLQAIAESKSVTAVDVFVYDTSKDSDGGAWRHRTQGTSWYNEALNTSTRGATKKFPAVAVIVSESDKVTIYDGDDPDMPMWMVFNATGTTWLYIAGGISTLAMLNGILCAGGNSSSNQRLRTVRFVHDDNRDYATTGSGGGIRAGGGAIVDRNSQYGFNVTIDGNTGIVERTINDIAMTVLPTAPIDADTGLPVPTIAVATDGGVSVIKDDGSVVDITFSSEGKVGRVAFIGDKIRLGGGSQNYIQYAERMYDIPTSDTALGAMYVNDSSALNVYFASSMATTASFNADMFYNGTTGNKSYAVKNAIGSSTGGLTHLYENFEDATKAMMAYATSDYNTGWMNGDIKLATLSDTDDTNISASGNTNLLSGGWTNNGSFPYETFTTSGLNITSAINTTAYGAANKVWTAVAGKTYTAYFNLTLNSGTAPTLFVQTSSSYGNGVNYQTVNGANSFTFTATMSTSSYFSFSVSNGVATNFSVANLELYEGGVADRSVNGTSGGLSVFGTVTKTAVATGADLVAYSGFSSSNYLEQPNNSDFEFGTGNWSMTGWISQNGTASTQHPIQLGLTSGSSSEISILRQTSSSSMLLGFRVRGDSGSYAANPAGGLMIDNVWTHFVLTKSGSQLHWYINGKLIHSVASSNVGNIGFSSSDILRIGHGTSVVTADVMKLALLRISATAPTAEQIAKMYNDEKHLFQDGAQATLYGTSDAVTALAYDDDTELLHAGTSAGRSVFQGLRRVDNTTDAVGVAISASNDLIVEE